MADSPTQTELEEVRKEEIVALSSIYEDDFTFINEESESFEIRITCEDDFWWSLTLKISLPLGYPQTEPPILEVFGECLTNDCIQKMYSELADIWLENIGTSVVYLWVEKCREMLFDAKTVSGLSESASAESDKSRTTTVDDNYMPEVTRNDDVELSPNEDFILQQANTKEPKTHGNWKKKDNDGSQFPEIISGEPIVDRKSTFQAHVANVFTEDQVKAVISHLKDNRKIARASHNIMAYRIETSRKDHFLHDCDDDGENEAGSRLMHLLEILNAKNIVVIVSRWYGGILLGPDRFKHINNCARELIVSSGIANSASELKGSSVDAKKPSKGKSKKANKH
ncbi:protein IMPACT-like [Rhopilema esculentum]|uniref:protein IMPACT-like n=1 Tax=Rhopilema esculentum TaxID=499914 RepID=UPI0031DB91CB